MNIGTIFAGVLFAAMAYSLLFPEKAGKLRNAVKYASVQTSCQLAALAYTEGRRPIKGYRSQIEARKHRVNLRCGQKIYFPDGTIVTVEDGMKDIEVDGWHYAWLAT